MTAAVTATKTQQKAQAAKIVENVTKQLNAQIDAQIEVVDDGKRQFVNKDGGILQCEITLARATGAPDPLAVMVNEQLWWLRRGHKQMVPWYVIPHLRNNIERKFRQEYGCEFVDPDESLFDSDVIRAAISEDVLPLPIRRR